MANIQCGVSQAVIYTDHTMDFNGFTFISGVTVDITTPKDDGTVVSQTLSITSEKFQQVSFFSLFDCLFVVGVRQNEASVALDELNCLFYSAVHLMSYYTNIQTQVHE